MVAAALAFSRSPNYATYIACVVVIAGCVVAKNNLASAVTAVNAARAALAAAFQNMCEKALALIAAQDVLTACQNNTGGHPCCP